MRNLISKYLPDVVYGGNDGIVTTFAIVAGFWGAGGTESAVAISGVVVLLFGLSNLFADAMAMGLGDFLSTQTQKQRYLITKQELDRDLQIRPGHYLDLTRAQLQKESVSPQNTETLIAVMQQDRGFWVNYIITNIKNIDYDPNQSAAKRGLSTFLSFVAFGSIPLIPFVAWKENPNVIFISVFATVLALILLGILRWLVIRDAWVRAIGEIVLVGSIAATVAFGVGTLFR